MRHTACADGRRFEHATRADERAREPRHKKQATGGERRNAQHAERNGRSMPHASHLLPLPPHAHASALPPLPPLPQPCSFEGCAAHLPAPSRAALELIDRSVGEFYHQTREAASALDGPATAMMRRVQAEVAAIWPSAVVTCFGSRATGLAGYATHARPN